MPAFLRRPRPDDVPDDMPDDEVPDELVLELDEEGELDDQDDFEEREAGGVPAPRGHVLLPAVGAFLLAGIGLACLMPDLAVDARHLLERAAGTTSAAEQAADRGVDPAAVSDDPDDPPAPPLGGALAPASAAPDRAALPGAPASPSAAPASSTASAAAPAARGESTGPASPPDLLAGPVGDDVLQQLMEDSLPNRLAAQDPAAADSPQAGEAVEVAWRALRQDLLAGGWSQPHRQVAVLTTTATVRGDGTLPATMSVSFMWSATTASGEFTDREISAVDLNRGGDTWAVDRIRTTGQS